MNRTLQPELSFATLKTPELEKRLEKSFMLSIPDIAAALDCSCEMVEGWTETGALPSFCPPGRQRIHRRIMRHDFIEFWNKHYSNATKEES